MATRKPVPASHNYDYTAKERLVRERARLKEANGARVETNLDAEELEQLDAFVAAGGTSSRRAALKHAVSLLMPPRSRKC